jgi:hypothetical protein
MLSWTSAARSARPGCSPQPVPRSLAFHLLPSLHGQRSACAPTGRPSRLVPQKSLKVRKTPWGSFAHLRSFPRFGEQRCTHSALCSVLFAPCSPLISPHLGRVLHHPRGEIQTVSPHRHSLTEEPQTTCAGTVGRNSPNFAPREKEKKFQWCKTHASDPRNRCFEQ